MKRLTAALVLMLAGVAACSADDDRPSVNGNIVQPGEPGEGSELLDQAPRIEGSDANDADIAFVQMMIPHHAQAIEMAELAVDAGGSRSVRVLADRIEGAQRPEILYMASWLTERDLEAPTAADIEAGRVTMDSVGGGHDHHGGAMATHDMAGMATDAQMAELAEARGDDFDRMFLELMINHHQGALEMVDDVVRNGSDLQVNELATGISADQAAEIQRMRELLEG